MKKLILIAALLLSLPCFAGSGRDNELLVMFWNLENFFDWKDEGAGESDREFSSSGTRRWTKTRFYTKCNAVAKSLLWIEDEYGRIPDVIGFAEVENRFVLNSLLRATALRKYDYGIVHYDSPDPRGIDVALIYRKSVFRKISSRPVRVGRPDQNAHGDTLSFLTRDILYVCLERAAEHDTLHFLVNHHPSKYGGAKVSGEKRAAAMRTMLAICDSIPGPNPAIVSMGDFNDTPDSPLFDFSPDGPVNLAKELHRAGEGTIRYRGKRELIDMFIVSEALASRAEMQICRIPFLTVRDNAYPGEKPLRTYSGPRYIGGVSDHCPIVLIM